MKCGCAISSVMLACDNIVHEWELPGPSGERFHEMKMVTQRLQDGGPDDVNHELSNQLDWQIERLHGDEVFFKLNDMAWDVMEAEAQTMSQRINARDLANLRYLRGQGEPVCPVLPLRRSARIKAMNALPLRRSARIKAMDKMKA